MSRRAELPPRPSLPPTLHVLAGIVAGEAAVLRCGWSPPAWALAAVAALLAVPLALGRPRLPRACCLLAIALAVGSLAGTAARWSLDRFSGELGSSPVSGWSLEVTGDPSLGEHGYRCRARASRPGSASGGVWLSCEQEPRLGETITCVGRFKPNGEDDWGASSRAQGVAGSVRVVRVLSRRPASAPASPLLRVRERALAAMGPRASGEAALVAASVCGYRAGMDEAGLTELFSSCGVSHLVAVSGGHLVIVSGILSVLLEAAGLRPRVRAPLLVCLTGAFVLFCGAPVSAVRSWLMAMAAAGSELAGRRGHSLSAVSVVGSAIALCDPFSSGELGFLLSVASVVGLCVLTPHVSYALGVALRVALPAGVAHGRVGGTAVRWAEALRDTLAATLVAQLVTAPLTMPVFGELSLVAPLANVALGPLFGPLIGAGMLSVPLCLLPGGLAGAAQAPLAVARGCAWLAVALLRPLARVPLASVHVTGWVAPAAAVALAGATYAVWPTVRRRGLLLAGGLCSLAVAAVLARWRLFAPARIVVLDVGQGDAILVQDGAEALLVDAGPDGSTAAALARQHVLHLDAVLLTHLHADHVGGLDELVGAVPCDRVIVARGVSAHVGDALGGSIAGLTGKAADEVSYGDSVRVGGFSLRVVSPVGEVQGDENADSLELVATYAGPGGSLTALLTGDAERDETGAALGRGDVGDVDLLKVGHHGSEVSLTAGEARALDPEVSVASAGEGNRYGHPAPGCVAVLEGAGSRFLCTKDAGDVEVRPGGEGPRVRYDGPHER